MAVARGDSGEEKKSPQQQWSAVEQQKAAGWMGSFFFFVGMFDRGGLRMCFFGGFPRAFSCVFF